MKRKDVSAPKTPLAVSSKRPPIAKAVSKK